MKKNINYICLILILFFPYGWVNAAEEFSSFYVGYQNVCSGSDQSFNGECSGSVISDAHLNGDSMIADSLRSTSSTDNVYISNSTTTKKISITDCDDDDNTKKISYSVVLLLDYTNSINSEEARKMKAAANNVLSKLKNKNKSSTGEYKLQVCTFNDKMSCSSFKKVKDMNNIGTLSKPSGEGWTDIQKALTTAYTNLKNSGTQNKNAPMVILVTDGYPTMAHTTVKSGNYSGGSKLTGAASARYAYYTAASFIRLKKDMMNLSNFKYASSAKLITLGVGLSSSDEYGKFILNPNSTNLSKLNKSDSELHSTESKTLYDLINGSKVNEVIFRGYPNPEKGVYRGIFNSSKKKITFKNIKVSQIKSDNDGYRYSCGSTVHSYGSVSSTVTISCNSVQSYGGHGKFTYVKSHIGDEAVDYSSIKTFDGLSTALGESIDSTIKDDVQCEKKEKDIVSSSTSISAPERYTKNYNKYNHTNSCSSNKYTLNNSIVYYKIPNSISLGNKTLSDLRIYDDYDTSDVSAKDIFLDDNNSYKTCVGVNVSFTPIVTEDSKFTLGTLGDVSYAGSGFSMKGAGLENSISWYYGSVDNNGNPLVSVSLKKGAYIRAGEKDDNFYYFSDSGGVPKMIDTLSNIPYDNLYSNANCSTKLYNNINSFNSIVWNKIKNNLKLSSDVSNLLSSSTLTSINSNDATKGDVEVGVDVNSSDVNSSYLSPNTISNSKVSITNNKKTNQLTYKYSFVFNRGCISTLSQGDIKYLDNSSGSCSAKFGNSYINGINEEGLNQWFVPINYVNNVVYLNAKGDLSNINGISINYSLKCPTNVNGGIYSCSNGSLSSSQCSLKYHYRSVDVNNPFPKAGSKSDVSFNWRDWYCGDDTSCISSNSNKVRLNNSYSSSSKYVINISKDSVINGSGVSISAINSINSLYTDWSGMSLDGNSAFVNDNFSSYLTANNGYCNLGMLNDNCE